MREYAKVIVLAAIASTLTILALSVAIPSSDDFMPDNPYWNGQNVFAKTVNVTFVDLGTVNLDPEKTVVFIISPEKNMSQEYEEMLKDFLKYGGTIVLMDETGKINPILEELDIGVKVVGYPIMDPIYYYRSWKLPKVVNINPSPITKDVEAIATDIPSAIEIENIHNVKVLAYTSYFSFMDVDGDGEPSKDDPVGPFPIAVETSYGNGKILVFSDSSLFINSVIGLGDNRLLLKNIVADKKAIVDSSQWNPSTHSKLRAFTLQAYSIISVPEIKYTIIACTIITYITVKGEKKGEEKADEIEEILKSHPEWNPQLLKTLKEARENVTQ